MPDVIICGGGIAGLYTASLIQKRFDVAVLERFPTCRNKTCSGLYSTNILKHFPRLPRHLIEHKIRGAIVKSRRSELVIKRKEVLALVVDRLSLNEWLSGRVDNILYSNDVKSVCIGKTVKVKTTDREFTSTMVVGADGANSVVRKHSGVKPKEIVNGLIATTKQDNHDDFVEIWIDKEKIQDGFFWKIPRGEMTEYGALGKNVKFGDIERFFKIKKYEKKASFMPCGPCKSYFDRLILIGDAAGITKPWSFGGVLYALDCSRIAHDVILRTFKDNDFSENSLKSYEDRWKKKLGTDIETGMIAREIFKSMDDKKIDELLKSLGETDWSKSDMDLPFSIF